MEELKEFINNLRENVELVEDQNIKVIFDSILIIQENIIQSLSDEINMNNLRSELTENHTDNLNKLNEIVNQLVD